MDRLLSNAGINVDELSERWVPYVIGQRPQIIVAMDWTDFDADDHATITSDQHRARQLNINRGLVHHAEIIAIDGESCRLKEATVRFEKRGRQRRGAKP